MRNWNNLLTFISVSESQHSSKSLLLVWYEIITKCLCFQSSPTTTSAVAWTTSLTRWPAVLDSFDNSSSKCNIFTAISFIQVFAWFHFICCIVVVKKFFLCIYQNFVSRCYIFLDFCHVIPDKCSWILNYAVLSDDRNDLKLITMSISLRFLIRGL